MKPLIDRFAESELEDLRSALEAALQPRPGEGQRTVGLDAFMVEVDHARDRATLIEVVDDIETEKLEMSLDELRALLARSR